MDKAYFETMVFEKVDKKFDVVFEKLDAIQKHTYTMKQDVAVLAAQAENDREKLGKHLDTHPVRPCKDLIEHKKSIRWFLGLTIPACIVGFGKVIWDVVTKK